MRTTKMKKYAIFCSIITVILVQCAFYSFKGSLPPHLKTVAIPLFENQTSEFGISEQLTDIIIDQFNGDGSLKMTEGSNADVYIQGSIVSISDRAGAFNRQEQVEDIKIYVTVQVECTDQVKRQQMWSERVTQYGSYDPAEGIEGRELAYDEAFEKISEQILNKTVSNW